MLPPFALAAERFQEQTRNELDEFITTNCTNLVYDDSDRITQYSIPGHLSERHRRLRKPVDDSGIFRALLPRMTVVTLVSVYDAYLGHLVRDLLRNQPEILNASDRQLTHSDLFAFDSLEEARQHLLEQEVESLLRDSHTDHFAWLEKRTRLSLRTGLDIWPSFIEVTERRHLFVHCDGVVNKNYVRQCKNAGTPSEELPEIGDKLYAPPTYFADACNTILEIGVKLGQVLWRKTLPDDLEEADERLIHTTYELLLDKEYGLAEKLAIFGITPPLRNSTTEHALYLRINLLISLKAQGKDDEFQQNLNAIDWTPLSDTFQLAHAALTEDWSTACTVMRRIGADGAIKRQHYQHWPLFMWLRETDEFKSAFADIFGEPFRVTHNRQTDETGDQEE